MKSTGKKYYSFFITCCIVAFCVDCKAQLLLEVRQPGVKTNISSLDSVYSDIDSVKFRITITNDTDTIKNILFNKPMKNYPWQSCVYLFYGEDQRIDGINCPYLISSSAYSIKDVRPYLIELKKGDTVSDIYYLNKLILFTGSKPSKRGRYYVSISYFGNKSNTVSFMLK
ncbi:hypothetical protein LT679_03835 [Mucilaginibacter roseus]|uniref:DUF4625 domain-containing protein n=1 Tax=Mucilaginibacter roseus TaxID=1528868 RepID=A0ABS8TXV6_9SPHI|nr:hypothetical protein [Mucilaginibacter roseus]MCD8739723.1 hypothetical protein [Mucilaginibacter roseus]